MAEAEASTSRTSVSTHENNIAMLLDKLKEFRMGADTTTRANVYSKVESKYEFLIIFWTFALQTIIECELFIIKLKRLVAERNR